MTKKLSVEYNTLRKVRDELDHILQNNIDDQVMLNYEDIKKRKKIDSEYELDTIEKEILNYIIDNPGTNKQNIINNLGISSRVPILKRITRLEKFGYVIERINEKNSSSHQLYYNDEDSLATLFKGLKEFKKSYFLLLDDINDILIELNKRSKKQLKLIREEDYHIDNKDTSLGDLYRVTEYTILPFKILIAILSFSDFIYFNMKDYNENVILHKFLIFNEFVKDVILKLRRIFLKVSEKQFDKNMYFIENLGREMLPTSIETNINFFAKYNLKETAKDLWNSLWKIIFPHIRRSNFYLEIRPIMEKNSVNSLITLLAIKKEYKDIEARYKPYTELRM